MAHLAVCRSEPSQPPLTARAPVPQGILVTTRLVGDTAVLRLEGDLDLSSAGPLEASVASVVGSGVCRLVLDMHDVTFLDCAGIRLLLTLREVTAARGGWLRLERVPAMIRRVLRLTETHVLLGVEP